MPMLVWECLSSSTWHQTANVVFGKIYFEVFNSSSAAVEALSNIDGSVRWSFPIPAGTSGKNGIAVANGVIYFVDRVASLYAVSATDGSSIWSSQVDGGPTSTVTIGGRGIV